MYRLKHFFPFLAWLTSYKKTYFLKDMFAGITVGIILVPQGMAYAMIAGLPPVYGLYASLFPVGVYALLGTSRKVAVGPVAMDSLLIALGLGALSIAGEEDYITMALVLVFMVGAIQFLLGIFKMGFLVQFLSKPVINGFTSAAAIIIILSQLKHVLGISVENKTRIQDIIIEIFDHMYQSNVVDFSIAVAGILVLFLLKKWNRNIPGILLIVVLGTLSVYFLHLENFGVKLVGKVPQGLPDFAFFKISVNDVSPLAPIAIAIALVGYLETISIGKALEEKSGDDTIQPNQELIALGTANMIGVFFQGYVSTASFSRSAINYNVGAKTNLAGIFSVVIVVLALLFLTPVFVYLPNAILASIIMTSVFNLIDATYAKRLWAHRKDEFLVLLITFLITLLVGITAGILLGVLCSLILLVYRTSTPHVAELANIKGTDYYKNIMRFSKEVIVRDDLLILRFDAQLYFGNCAYFKRELSKRIARKGSKLKAVILSAEAISYIDATAAQVLQKSIQEIHDEGIQFYFVGAIGPTRDIIFNSELITEVTNEYVFVNIKDAVDYFDHLSQPSALSHKIACENKDSHS